jgi:hypothetical protein
VNFAEKLQIVAKDLVTGGSYLEQDVQPEWGAHGGKGVKVKGRETTPVLNDQGEPVLLSDNKTELTQTTIVYADYRIEGGFIEFRFQTTVDDGTPGVKPEKEEIYRVPQEEFLQILKPVSDHIVPGAWSSQAERNQQSYARIA